MPVALRAIQFLKTKVSQSVYSIRPYCTLSRVESQQEFLKELFRFGHRRASDVRIDDFNHDPIQVSETSSGEQSALRSSIL